VIKYKLNVKVWPVFVSVDANNADRHAPIVFEGSEYAVKLAREHLFQSHGIDGHFIEAETTPLDLAVAMTSQFMVGFTPQLVEGADVLKTSKRKGNP
jgi:hypothetical protein